MRNNSGIAGIGILIAIGFLGLLAGSGVIIRGQNNQIHEQNDRIEALEARSGLILGAITGSGSFPTSSRNNFQDGDVINAGDWNALERKIGIDNSTDTTSLDYWLRNVNALNPGHEHEISGASSSVSGTLPVANGGTGRATLTAGSLLVGSGTDAVAFLAPGAADTVLTSNGTAWSAQEPSDVLGATQYNTLSLVADRYVQGNTTTTLRDAFFDAQTDTTKSTTTSNLTQDTANRRYTLSSTNLTGVYTSKVQRRQGDINSVTFWVQGNATSTFGMATTASGTLVRIPGERYDSDFIVGDQIVLFEKYNTSSEIRRVTAVAYNGTTDETEITIASALTNTYPSSTSWVRKANVIPEASVVDINVQPSWASSTYSKQILTNVASSSDVTYAVSSSSITRAMYRLETVADDSNNGFALTNNNSVAFGTQKSQKGADLGSNLNKSLSVANDLGIAGGNITIAGWFKFNATPTSSVILAEQEDAGVDVGYYIDYDGTSLGFHRNVSGVADNSSSSVQALGTSSFHHIVLTYDGANVRGYLNGSLIATVASTGNGSGGGTDFFGIGQRAGGGQRASIIADDVVVENVVWSAEKIKAVSNFNNAYTMPWFQFEVEDEYTYGPATDNEDLQLRFQLRRADTTTAPWFGRILAVYK